MPFRIERVETETNRGESSSGNSTSEGESQSISVEDDNVSSNQIGSSGSTGSVNRSGNNVQNQSNLVNETTTSTPSDGQNQNFERLHYKMKFVLNLKNIQAHDPDSIDQGCAGASDLDY